MAHFVDQLIEKIDDKQSPICVGIDPVYDRLPATLRETHEAEAIDQADGDTEVLTQTNEHRVNAIFEFVVHVLHTIAPIAPCVKFQSACFERYGSDGLDAYHCLIHEAKSLDLSVIGDVKRGDIGTSAAHYAAATLVDGPTFQEDEQSSADSVTINSYFGLDGIDPFLKTAQAQGKGAFALVRTSNPSGDTLQSLELAQGGTVAEAVARLIAEIGSESAYIGQSGYSLLGAVVGATKPQDAARLRELMPQQLFLVPGFGAQGGSVDDIRACFQDDGRGALVTASRSITYAYESNTTDDWVDAVEQAAMQMHHTIRSVLS